MRGVLTYRQVMIASVVVVLGIASRQWIGSVNPHSGQNSPPMFGDFEAQRHWVEVTSNLPLHQWYVHDPVTNNLTYWGLDYPPLTAFHSMFIGWVARQWMGQRDFLQAFGLVVSHGSEDSRTVSFMRGTALVSDVVVYFSAALAMAFLLGVDYDGHLRSDTLKRFLETLKRKKNGPKPSDNDRKINLSGGGRSVFVSVIFVLIHGSISMTLIDHAHFQYNSVSLGLVLWAVYFAGKHISMLERSAAFLLRSANETEAVPPPPVSLASLMASIGCAALSMAFKQMSLYYAPGLGIWYLGECIRCSLLRAAIYRREQRTPERSDVKESAVVWSALLASILRCAAAGLGSFAVVLSPFYWTSTLGNVVTRVFPVGRGLYEDKVANVWCVISPIFKLPAFVERAVRYLAPNEVITSERIQGNVLFVCLVCTIAGVFVGAVATIVVAMRTKSTLAAAGKVATMNGDIDQEKEIAVKSQQRFEQLLWVMFVSSSSFYLFAYQVHEKSILLPLLPCLSLIALMSRATDTLLKQTARGEIGGAHIEQEMSVIQDKRTLLWTFVFFSHLSLSQLATKDGIESTFTVTLLLLGWKMLTTCNGPSTGGRRVRKSKGGNSSASSSSDATSDDESERDTVKESPGYVKISRLSNKVREVWASHTIGALFCRVMTFALLVEEIVRAMFLEGHPRYPHLGTISRFGVCCTVFVWCLARGSWYLMLFAKE